MLTIDRTSQAVACTDAGRSSMKTGRAATLAQAKGLRAVSDDAQGNERLSARRYRPSAVQCTRAVPSSRPVVAMIGSGKRRVAANLFAAVHTVSHLASPVIAGMVTWSGRRSWFEATLAAAFLAAISPADSALTVTPRLGLSRLSWAYG